MVGFIKGLFGSKKSKDSIVEQQRTPVEPTQAEKTYFLSADEAKTYGNIDYMRTPKKTRRTFPKTVTNGKVSEFVQSVSSMEMKRDGESFSTPSSAPSANPEKTSSSPTAERRRSDSSMDMFRNMAKDIKR
jgi:hypothetical protein